MIPKTAHFIWIGSAFPWTNVLAIKSAALRGDFDQVILHHTDDLSHHPWWSHLAQIPRVQTRWLQPQALLATCAGGADLWQLYQRQTTPSDQCDMLRLALLASEGGVYLDLDTVTVRSLAPLCAEAGFFCGREYIAWPGAVVRSQHPLVLTKSVLLDAIRLVFRVAPGGWQAFRRIESWYYAEVNGAILGARPGHPLLLALLNRMLEGPQDRKMKWSSVHGPHLLQAVLHQHQHSDVCIHPPAVFYPLPPEISQHWFKRQQPPHLETVLSEQTRVVHWYASVRTQSIVPRISPDYVYQHADQQLFSALALPFVEA